MTARGLAGVKAGDELILREGWGKRSEDKTVLVHKVGRTLVHILAYPNRPDGGTNTFRISDGTANNGGRSYLITPQQKAEQEERSDLLKRLNEQGLEFRSISRDMNFPLDRLRAVVAVLEETGPKESD